MQLSSEDLGAFRCKLRNVMQCCFSAVPGELRRDASTRWKLPLLLQTKNYDLNHMEGEGGWGLKKKDCTGHAIVFYFKFLIRCLSKKKRKGKNGKKKSPFQSGALVPCTVHCFCYVEGAASWSPKHCRLLGKGSWMHIAPVGLRGATRSTHQLCPSDTIVLIFHCNRCSASPATL